MLDMFGNKIRKGIKKVRKIYTKNAVSKRKALTNSEEVNPLLNKDYKINGTKKGLSKIHIEILKKCLIESTASQLKEIVGMTNSTKFKNNYINKLIDFGYLEYIDPKFINRVSKVIKIDENGNIIKGENGKMIYIDELSANGEIITKKCIRPNPKQKYRLTSKFVCNKLNLN